VAAAAVGVEAEEADAAAAAADAVAANCSHYSLDEQMISPVVQFFKMHR